MKKTVDILYAHYIKTPKCVSKETVTAWLEDMLSILFPVSKDLHFPTKEDYAQHLETKKQELHHILHCSLNENDSSADEFSRTFFEYLPALLAKLSDDIDAAYAGDPAAHTRQEVVRSYPGLLAIAAYRIAHFFHERQVPIVPRMITECAHSMTGIDIHPGAEIGHSFFIDHGTGVVIGETAVIGDHVKIYQGVTLGGLSVDKADEHRKRHPTIEDNVVIYAGATILGGETVIGKGSIIGGNTFITRSIKSGSKVYYIPQNKQSDI